MNTQSPTHGVSIQQKRSKITHDRLIASGFSMMKLTDLQEIPIQALTREAGYSVGAFYSRFRSKDEFFCALLAKHLEIRTSAQETMFATLSNEVLIGEMIHNVVTYYWEHRKFWRAVLARSMRDSEFWEPVRKHGHAFASRFTERLTREIGRSLGQKESENVAIAFQVTLGTINSTVINQHGPIFMGQKRFIDELVRAFQLISGFDNLVKAEACK